MSKRRPHFSTFMQGQPRKPGSMNKTEQRYADELRILEGKDEITWWKFEPIKLRLASNTFYTPDFMVMYPNGMMEIVEIKGFWTEKARVKTKVAASEYFMFRFIALKTRSKKNGGGWEREDFN